MGETRRRTPFVALTALCITGVLATVGCSADGASLPSSSPTSTATPSDAAVLSAVLDVYARYSAALDAVLANGDGDYSTLEPVTTPEFLERLSSGGTLEANNWVTTGSTSFDSEELVSATDSSVTVRLCRDVSRVTVRDQAGANVTPDDRTERFAVAVTFVKASSAAEYLVDSSERDPEDESCEG